MREFWRVARLPTLPFLLFPMLFAGILGFTGHPQGVAAGSVDITGEANYRPASEAALRKAAQRQVHPGTICKFGPILYPSGSGGIFDAPDAAGDTHRLLSKRAAFCPEPTQFGAFLWLSCVCVTMKM